jgi:hypothetical protein
MSTKVRRGSKQQAENQALMNYFKLTSKTTVKGLMTVNICKKTMNGQNWIVVKKFVK